MHYYRYSNPEVSCWYKYLLFSYNIIFWLAGVAFLAAGLWAWSEKGVLSDLTKVTRLHGFDPVVLILMVGGVMFILGFAGCVGALRENICLLKFFCGAIVLIFMLELTAAVLAFVFQDWVRDRFKEFFENNIKSYRDDIDLQNLIDSLQKIPFILGYVFTAVSVAIDSVGSIERVRETRSINPRWALWSMRVINLPERSKAASMGGISHQHSTMKTSGYGNNYCCGAQGPDDWDLNIYFNCSTESKSREKCGVPFSCCVPDPAQKVVNTQCGYDIRAQKKTQWDNLIFTKGCIPALEAWLPRNIYIVAGVFIGISLLQIFGIFLARSLISDIDVVKAGHHF